jgi:hypothetical protein
VSTNDNWRGTCAFAIFLLLLVPALTPAAAQQIRTMERHGSGQNVAPVFDGWAPNADGTFNLYFGYLNRNYEEEPDIPVGPNNKMEPGADRGQPTHFLPRRHSEVFAVTVPKDFGDQKVIWTISVHDATASAIGSLNPQWQLDVARDSTTGNTPPVVKAEPVKTVVLPATATLTVAVTDDGLPKHAARPGPQAPRNIYVEIDRARLGMNDVLTVEWGKYRGPGTITFTQASQPVSGGKASTKATFSAPGVYTIQAVADDGSRSEGFYCCWTSAQIQVTVKAAAGPSAQR